jgi:hypothetical protein
MVNREKQAEVLRRTQAKRKEQKKDQVLKAIQKILKEKKPLTFKNIATVSGCSVSYLYKWDDIKAYIHELQNQKETTLNSLEEPEDKERPHSLKTLHQVAKDKIHKLEEEIRELKRQNEILRGHVAEIYEIRDENERLRSQLRELTSSNSSSKIVPIRSFQAAEINLENATSPAQIKDEKNSYNPKQTNENLRNKIINSLKEMDIKVSKKLREEIRLRDPERVQLSIEAFKQYRDSHEVKSQEACLLSMICDEAEPNTESKPIISKPQHKIVTASNQPQKELVSLDKLKQLSSLFGQDND